MNNKLILDQKYIDLLEYSYNLLKKYPKHEKYALVLEIKNNIYFSLKNIYLIKSKKLMKIDKKNLLYDIDCNLMLLKQFVRISYKEKYISVKNYEEWSRRIIEVGKLIGGLINNA